MLITSYRELAKYLDTPEGIEQLLDNTEAFVQEIERIAQLLRQGKIDNPVLMEEYDNRITGIGVYLRKIAKSIYCKARMLEAERLLEYTTHWKMYAPEEADSKDDKKKFIKFSSTVAKAKAESSVAVYYQVATFLNSYVEEISSISMTLSSNKKSFRNPKRTVDPVIEEPDL